MRWLSNLTIRRRLTSISVLSSVTALLFSSQAFLAYDAYTFRQSLARRIVTAGEILVFNSVSHLLFGDQEAATSALGSLKAEPSVLTAAIFASGQSQSFASYSRDGQSPMLVAPPGGPLAEPRFGEDGLLVSVPIRSEGQVLGQLLIRAELSELRERQWRYLGLGLIVLAGSFLLALAFSRTVETTISVPVLELAAAARAVSERKDYSVRARAAGRDELGELVGTFNEMLDHIERQNADLEQARGELERRVELRTLELAASNKEMEAFAYSVSHDLRAPLRAIDGFSKALLQQAAGLDEQGRHYLQRVRAGTQRMGDLIDDMLGLARISRKELVRQPLELSVLAGRVAAELGGRHAEQAVALQIAPGLQATADARLVTVLFENLLGNAWKFSSRKQHPRVEVGRQDGAPPVFYVRDNGAGFDMTYADKLFGAFQRLHSDAEFEGTGIGLATVQRIVHRHGGRVWAQAQPGQGATFYFTLEAEP